jgi:HAD superfamily hydrolase (TIGR01490 family)
MAPRRGVLFDLDRTLVRKDTATLYTRYLHDRGEAGWRDTARVAWWMLQYSVGVIDAERVARQALASYRGRDELELAASCEVWVDEYVMAHVSAAARSVVERHRRQGDVAVIVTGATRYAALPLARRLGIEHVVCTELEVDAAGKLTGELVELCYGPSKITLAGRIAEREGFELSQAAFYTDSITDRPLLEHVAEPVAVNPDARLRRLARQKNWRIERW